MNERTTGIVAGLLGVLAALGLVLLIMTLTGGDDQSTITAPSTTTLAPTTTQGSTTTAVTTTLAPTTTAAPTTTIAFVGDLADKNCEAEGSPEAGSITAVRFAQHPGYTRIVFDFDGAIPACFVEQIDPTTIAVTVWGVAGDPPYGPGVFDGSGTLAVGTEQVVAVTDAGMGGGSGEWVFHIVTIAPDHPFTILTLEDPSRLVIDIGA